MTWIALPLGSSLVAVIFAVRAKSFGSSLTRPISEADIDATVDAAGQVLGGLT